MTREEQIEEAIDENWSSLIENEDPEIAFRNGIKWADSHPNWHQIDYTNNSTYNNTVPDNGAPVIVAFRYHDHDTIYIEIATFSLEGGSKVYNGPGIVLAWMELPQPPKFD